ncbi:MAG TPA: hypothetical protein DD618_01470 [Acholeplasmatales bacterium]|nr:hypothetical protein [Acholeplasmatales bacterium]
MFKKLCLLLVVVASVFALSACGKEERTYVADGVYTAFSADLTSKKGPQMTSVSVTIEDDEIVSFFIDCTQSAVATYVLGDNPETTEVVETDFQTNVPKSFAFNAQSKKEMGYLYGMHNANDTDPAYTKQTLTEEAGLNAYKAYLTASGQKEWFEQAALLEAFFVAQGPEAITVDATSEAVNNVTGVTIKDGGYSDLAAEAVELAIAGKVQTVIASGANIVWATAMVNAEGEYTSILLDTLQGKVTAGEFAWNAKSKQELGYLYGLHNADDDDPVYTKQNLDTVDGLNAYKAYLTASGQKEWFEQVKLLTDYVLENGWDGEIVVDAVTGDLDAANSAAAVASVSITVKEYAEVLEALYPAA